MPKCVVVRCSRGYKIQTNHLIAPHARSFLHPPAHPPTNTNKKVVAVAISKLIAQNNASSSCAIAPPSFTSWHSCIHTYYIHSPNSNKQTVKRTASRPDSSHTRRNAHRQQSTIIIRRQRHQIKNNTNKHPQHCCLAKRKNEQTTTT